MPSLPCPRGWISEQLLDALRGEPHQIEPIPVRVDDRLADEDLHLSLYVCYELFYRSFDEVDPRWEWEASLLAVRGELESAFERELRGRVGEPVMDGVDPSRVPEALREIAESDDAPSLSRFIEREAGIEQLLEFMIHRSAYQLKEADPHTWAIPRMFGSPKAAIVEVQADEYGGGRPERIHASMFAQSMSAVRLDPAYGAYLDRIPGVTLATVNLISLCGLHRRRLGAIVGHLALFEMTSSIPNRRYGDGMRRLGFGRKATAFFDEHVLGRCRPREHRRGSTSPEGSPASNRSWLETSSGARMRWSSWRAAGPPTCSTRGRMTAAPCWKTGRLTRSRPSPRRRSGPRRLAEFEAHNKQELSAMLPRDGVHGPLANRVSGETITGRERREVVLLADREELSISWSRYAPGERGPEPHVHREHVDSFYVLDGELAFALGPEAERTRLQAGSLLAVPVNLIHSFVNEGPTEAQFLNFHTPDGGFADFLRAGRGGAEAAFDSCDPPEMAACPRPRRSYADLGRASPSRAGAAWASSRPTCPSCASPNGSSWDRSSQICTSPRPGSSRSTRSRASSR